MGGDGTSLAQLLAACVTQHALQCRYPHVNSQAFNAEAVCWTVPKARTVLDNAILNMDRSSGHASGAVHG